MSAFSTPVAVHGRLLHHSKLFFLGSFLFILGQLSHAGPLYRVKFFVVIETKRRSNCT